MQQQNQQAYHFQNGALNFKMFVEQSDNRELIIGKISITTKKQISPIQILLQIKGVYKIWDIPKKDSQYSHQSHIDFSQTLSQFDNIQSKRKQKGSLVIDNNETLQTKQRFMEGQHKITQSAQIKVFEQNKTFTYPFLFNIPSNMPPTQEAIYFANKRIQIGYFLSIRGRQSQSKMELFNQQFQIQIRQPPKIVQKTSKLCKTLEYRCYTRFFCTCLGTYHLQLNATILYPGKMQIQGRLFREGKTTQNIISSIDILLYGQLKKEKKLLIGQRKMVLRQSDYEMFQGEVLMGYDPQLKTFQSQLITIRFWVQCSLQFHPKIWKFQKKNVTTDVNL